MTFVFHEHPNITMLGDFLDERYGHALFQHDGHERSPGHMGRHEFKFWLPDLDLFHPAEPNDPDRTVNFSNFPDFFKVFVKFLI